MKNKSKSRIDDNWICVDCQKDCAVDDKDYYMVNNDVWEKYGVGEKMLCIECLEQRIGHSLTKSEILDCPLNNFLNPYTREIIEGKPTTLNHKERRMEMNKAIWDRNNNFNTGI